MGCNAFFQSRVQNLFRKEVAISIFRTSKVMVLPEGDLVYSPQLEVSHNILLSLISWRVNCSHCTTSLAHLHLMLCHKRLKSFPSGLSEKSQIINDTISDSQMSAIRLGLFQFSNHRSACEGFFWWWCLGFFLVLFWVFFPNIYLWSSFLGQTLYFCSHFSHKNIH